jgi:gamma-glutamyltranspeptidase
VAVASPHHLATAAAARAVELGGNAIDAAIAAATVLTVVYPHQCSVGGDLIAMVREPSGRTRAVLSVGASAGQLDVDEVRARHTRMPGRGPLTVTVPGFVAGLTAIAGQGARLPLASAFGHAATLAELGVAISAGLARALAANAAVLAGDPGAASVLLHDNIHPPRVGETLVQPALASTLRRLAESPTDIYTGELAAVLADGLRRCGSPLDDTDLAAHRAELADPVAHRRGDVLWSVPPPPSQAVALLAVLGDAFGRPAGQVLARSMRVAAVRDAQLADPRVAMVPIEKFFTAADAETVAILSRGKGMPRPNGDTVAVTAVDSDGLAVSIVASVYQSFGSGLLEPNTGIVLHNRGSAFSLEPDHPGRLRPGARPPHTLSPVIAVRDGGRPVVAAIGCQGGRAQPWILAQIADDLLEPASDDLPTMLRAPRWVFGSRDIGAAEPTLVVETDAVPDDLAEVAAAYGLATLAMGAPWDEAGHVQVARLDHLGAGAAADPRADGSAITVTAPQPTH